MGSNYNHNPLCKLVEFRSLLLGHVTVQLLHQSFRWGFQVAIIHQAGHHAKSWKSEAHPLQCHTRTPGSKALLITILLRDFLVVNKRFFLHGLICWGKRGFAGGFRPLEFPWHQLPCNISSSDRWPCRAPQCQSTHFQHLDRAEGLFLRASQPTPPNKRRNTPVVSLNKAAYQTLILRVGKGR